MPVGIDTGFFFALEADQQDATRLWSEEHEIVTSAIVLFELERQLLKGRLRANHVIEEYLNEIEKVVTVAPVDATIARRAARITHGAGLHGADALILATLLEAGCSKIYTRDQHMMSYHQDGLQIHLI